MVHALQPGRWKPASGARTRGIIDVPFLGLKTADKKEEDPPPLRAQQTRDRTIRFALNGFEIE
jgi:hypothetical protein